ncbi:glycosyltransferase family 39 protein [Flavobacteriaceae bacterium S0862]|nr:glycosyltransferase family 39 protein [Flavobacteriaceae bacterium S0862]
MNLNKNENSYSIYITFTVISVVLFIFTRALGFDGLYGQDSYEYLRYANELFNSLNGEKAPGDYFWPLYYPLIGAIVNFGFQDMKLTLNLITLIAFVVSSIYIYKIIRLLYSTSSKAPHYIILFFILSPAIFSISMVVMSDMLSACFIILSIYHALSFKKHNILKSLYFATVFAMCAIMTRYASFVILFPFGILVLFRLTKNKRQLLHLIPIIVIVGVLSIPHFYIRSENVSGFLNHDWLQQWSFFNFFKKQFDTSDGTTYNKFPNIIYAFFNAFHPRFFIIGLVLLIVNFIKDLKFKPNKALLFAYLLYSLFMAGIPFQNSRFLVLNYSLVLILLFPTFQYLLARFSERIKITNNILLLLVLVQICLCYYAFRSFYNRNLLEKKITTLMEPYQNRTLYSFDIDVDLKGRALNFDYKNMWIERYNKLNSNDLVLFNPEKFKNQWKDKNPILNWENIKNNYQLKILEEGPQGWKLYEIHLKE